MQKDTLEDIASRMRSGYIRGQHAYEAGDSLKTLDLRRGALPTLEHVEGYQMGWQARYAAENCDLEPSALGVLDGKAPDRWWS